jgi:ubiquitin-protein ligase
MTTVSDAFRAERLTGDAEEMGRIRCPLIEWAAEGQPPVRYVVTYRLGSFVDRTSMRDVHRVLFELGSNYPAQPPVVHMLDLPRVFHPNIFPSGAVCIGPTSWTVEEGLGFLVIRVAKMLLFFDEVTNPFHPANTEAAVWYKANRHRFPLDRTVRFPDPLTGIRSEQLPLLIVPRGSK